MQPSTHSAGASGWCSLAAVQVAEVLVGAPTRKLHWVLQVGLPPARLVWLPGCLFLAASVYSLRDDMARVAVDQAHHLLKPPPPQQPLPPRLPASAWLLQSEQVRALLQLVDPSGQDLVRRLGQLVGTSRVDQEAILTLLPTVPRLDRSGDAKEDLFPTPPPLRPHQHVLCAHLQHASVCAGLPSAARA